MVNDISNLFQTPSSKKILALKESQDRIKHVPFCEKVKNKILAHQKSVNSPIPNFSGVIYLRDGVPGSDYDLHTYQYAKSTNDHDMKPDMVAYATSDNDVIAAIRYAVTNKFTIAVRSGGHQYTGFSGGFNDSQGQGKKIIVLDLSQAYGGEESFDYDPVNNLVTVGVTIDLELLTEIFIGIYEETGLALFLPHGICKAVNVGGHVQTGGYGTMQRAFGLFSDYVISFDIFTTTGVKQTITKESNPHLFGAVLGGGPGNYGVVTTVTFQPLVANEFPNSAAMIALTGYDPSIMSQLLALYASVANDNNYSGDIDFYITAGSAQNKAETNLTYDDWMRINEPEIYGTDEINPPLLANPYIQVVIQYAGRTNPGQSYDPTLFNAARAILDQSPYTSYPLSEQTPTPLTLLSYASLYLNIREFDMAYVKRAYVLSDQVDSLTFPNLLTTAVSDVMVQDPDNLKLIVQVALCGGVNSALNNPTGPATGANTFDWRSLTRGAIVFDVFYRACSDDADLVQSSNDISFAAQQGFTDLRMVWATFLKDHDSYDMKNHKTWQLYYTEPTYTLLTEVKDSYDPSGIFSSNSFSIPPAESKLTSKPLEKGWFGLW